MDKRIIFSKKITFKITFIERRKYTIRKYNEFSLENKLIKIIDWSISTSNNIQ